MKLDLDMAEAGYSNSLRRRAIASLRETFL